MQVTFKELMSAVLPVHLPPGPIGVAVLTSCTGMKRAEPAPAEDLYTGRQHVALMDGVRAFRRSPRAAGAHVWIVSAKHGVVAGDQVLAPYERTFQGMPKARIRQEAALLGIADGVVSVLYNPHHALRLVLLGDDYLEACQGALRRPMPGQTVVFAGHRAARVLPRHAGLWVVGLAQAEARQYHAGLVSLKGVLAAALLRRLGAELDHDERAAPGSDLVQRAASAGRGGQ